MDKSFKKSNLARVGQNVLKGGKSSFHPKNWDDTYVFAFLFMTPAIGLAIITAF